MVAALACARESPEGANEATVVRALSAAIERIEAAILAEPNSYIMNWDDASVFNYFQDRHHGIEVFRRAVARFWDNPPGPPPSVLAARRARESVSSTRPKCATRGKRS
ncbi:hypothetical protein B0T25DRAFT_529824 [Lasiosphaeria hispida]|uniref:Uncharacterized protein n=1 Tax=Lasiosphaeria hispida TaxID=260671 RepID=A0AAJ0ML19_9PEZI|nr:hypothetical protein B0T25DRAFT_529824 [Lasiosphaeria hispida]